MRVPHWFRPIEELLKSFPQHGSQTDELAAHARCGI